MRNVAVFLAVWLLAALVVGIAIGKTIKAGKR